MATLEKATVRALPPLYREGMFSQQFIVRAPVQIKSSRSMKQISQGVMAQFQRTLDMNKISNHAWPPHHVELTPHADFMGFEVTFGTYATQPGGTVLNFTG